MSTFHSVAPRWVMTGSAEPRKGYLAPAPLSPIAQPSHLRDTYDYFREDITTADEFICLCGTRSEMTHQPYKVRLADGKERPAAEWLRDELRSIRKPSR